MAGGLFSDGSGSGVLDFPALLDSHLADGIARLLQMGVLVALGSTRDRGALSVTITNDGAYDRVYLRTTEELGDYLERAANALRDMGIGQDEPEPPTRKLATRRRQKLT